MAVSIVSSAGLIRLEKCQELNKRNTFGLYTRSQPSAHVQAI